MVKDDSNLRSKKKQRTREDILDAGQELFLQKGFNDVSVDDIAELAFVSRPTIYNYFPYGKDEIYFQLGINFFSNADKILRSRLEALDTGLDQFMFMCEMTFVAAERNPLLFNIIAEFYLRLNTRDLPFERDHDKIAEIAYSEEYSEYRETYEEPYLLDFYLEMQRSAFLWGSTVEKGREDGTIKRRESVDHIFHFVHLTITGVIEQSLHRRATLSRIGLDIENIKKQTLKIIKNYALEE